MHSSQPRGADKKDFQGQLFESTFQRLQRERAEQRRFAKERAEGSGGRNAALTFGKRYLQRGKIIADRRQSFFSLRFHATTLEP
jgi:hypothetical protein